MAIHVNNPSTIGNEVVKLYEVTTNQGKNLIDSLSTTIQNLGSHWKGSDAVANLTDLANVYAAVKEYVMGLQKLIVAANNNEIIPLLKHIQMSGGSSYNFTELAPTISGDTSIAFPKESLESWSDPSIITDAADFDSFPSKFQSFISALIDAKKDLLANWLEGANRAEVVNAFSTFEENVATYQSKIELVRNNINTVAENKKKFM